MGWFDTKSIDLYTYSDAKDQYGVNRKGYALTTSNIDCDVQPYSSEKAKIEYGYNIKTTKRVFCDAIDGISESAVIDYSDHYYSIEKLIEWDDFYELLILEKYDVVILQGGGS